MVGGLHLLGAVFGLLVFLASESKKEVVAPEEITEEERQKEEG